MVDSLSFRAGVGGRRLATTGDRSTVMVEWPVVLVRKQAKNDNRPESIFW